MEESVRNSIFACEREKTSSVSTIKRVKSKRMFNDNEIVLNPEYDQIFLLENKNVVISNEECLQNILLYLYETENTVFESESYNSIIKRITYKNGVIIYLNEDYNESLSSCKLLDIPFKNQTRVSLANEAFQIYTRSDKLYSTFNSESKKVFNDFMKGPFVYSTYLPKNSDNLTHVDINKCYTSCLSYRNDHDWPVYTIFDEITEFKGKLRPGSFALKLKTTYLLKRMVGTRTVCLITARKKESNLR